ncbi:hypothetical protein ACS0TY_029799 [Phlomoides rotata]
MSRPEYLRICRLLDESLHCFSDLASDSLSEEIEKNLLIALSQVFRQVKQLTNEYDSDEELLSEPVNDSECSIDSTASLDNRCCLSKIIASLMSLLAVNSRYAQHLAVNTLVAISEFLLTSDADWDDYMQLLCLSLELAICNTLRNSSETNALESKYSDYDPSTLRSFKLKLENANWCVVAAIFQVLRNIQKYLNQDFDDKIMKAYLDSVSSLMLNLPWDLLREIYVGHNTEELQGSPEDIRELTMLYGNSIQFLCSLVNQSSSLEDGLGFSPFFCRITNLVPKLTAWCHADIQSSYHVRISHYFRHKVLMLMVKLSSRSHIEQSISVTWMHLIHKYFEDLLVLPITGGKYGHDDFLEDSPFSSSIFHLEKQTMPSRHLQRLTIFLFLKCSLKLVSTKGSSGQPQCAYEKLKPYCSTNLKLDSECCSNSNTLIELHEWLQSHVPADILLNDELYSERCMRFTLSFLQLFMDEDDILFKMLLQLFHVPFYPERHFIIKDEPLSEVGNQPVFLAADLFNPIHLFHLFLAEIHYDHLVLLDYLISKDSGSSCAEYLLRSLRIVCNSWILFVEFPGMGEDLGQLCVKRQKILTDCTDFKGGLYPASLKDIETSSEHKEGDSDGSKRCRNYRQPFMRSRDCLVALTSSINSLNQKKLFPYNPKVLLQRLMRFQELCISH